MEKDKKYKLYKGDVLYQTIATIKEDVFKDNLDLQLSLANIPSAALCLALSEDVFLGIVVPALLCNSSFILLYNRVKKYLCNERLEYLQFLLKKQGINIDFLEDYTESHEIYDEKNQKYILNSFSDDKKIISKDNERFIYYDKDNYDGIEVTDAIKTVLPQYKRNNRGNKK